MSPCAAKASDYLKKTGDLSEKRFETGLIYTNSHEFPPVRRKLRLTAGLCGCTIYQELILQFPKPDAGREINLRLF